jgi:DtxR family transcriptional regulator, Mn-dependent transcriptional regulator
LPCWAARFSAVASSGSGGSSNRCNFLDGYESNSVQNRSQAPEKNKPDWGLIAGTLAGLTLGILWPRCGILLPPGLRLLIIVPFSLGISALGLWVTGGLLAHWRALREQSARVLREDALKHILKARANGHCPTLHSLAGALHLRSDAAAELLTDMQSRKLISFTSGELDLTETGHEAALHVVRAHRPWESLLADQTGVAETKWHGNAEAQEHRLPHDQANALSARLGHPKYDPHGDVIPVPGGRLPEDQGVP